MFIRSGGGIANSALYKSLCKNYAGRIDVLHYAECIPEGNVDNLIPVPPVSTTLKVKFLFFSGKIHRFTPWLDNYLKDNAALYSHCIINTGLLGDYVDLLHQYGIKVAVIHHNYEVEFQMDNKKPSTFWGITDRLVRKQEALSYINADFNFFLTPDDQLLFHRNYQKASRTNEYVIGIFDNREICQYTDYQKPLLWNKLAICGSLNSIQTIHGLSSFRKVCLPSLINYYKNDFKLIIAGRDPGKKILNLENINSNIKVIPNPASITDVIQDCGIFICPTDVGGGIKLRIMDGLKMGMPILAHKVSARGYNMLFDKPWFKVYDGTNSFENGLESIVNYITTHESTRTDVLKEYKKYFSFEDGDERFRNAIDLFLN